MTVVEMFGNFSTNNCLIEITIEACLKVNLHFDPKVMWQQFAAEVGKFITFSC